MEEVTEMHLEKVEKIIDDLEDKVDDLREEIQLLRRQLAMSSPRDVESLIASVNEYLDWVDSPNTTMEDNLIEIIHVQLRGAVDDALRELR